MKVFLGRKLHLQCNLLTFGFGRNYEGDAAR